jgi:hypothetical protein
MTGVRVLETLVRTAPLGVRLLDVSTRAPATGALAVAVAPLDPPGPMRMGRPTGAGNHAFANLPGLRAYEWGEWPENASPPRGQRFVLWVEDDRRRYLSWAAPLTLPRSTLFQGLMFPLPARPPIPGLALIRGALIEDGPPGPDGHPPPARFARIEARLTANADPFLAVADERGQFALYLPWPNPLQPPSGMPPSSPNTAGRAVLDELRWPVMLRFFYQPSAQRHLARDAGGRLEWRPGPAPADGLPELTGLLTQAEATPAGSPPLESPTVEIVFGREAALRGPGDTSELRLVPAPPTSP